MTCRNTALLAFGRLVLAGLALAGLAVPIDAWAQDSKDLMGKAQSQSEQRAVEDLIRKLQSKTGPKGAAPPRRLPPPRR